MAIIERRVLSGARRLGKRSVKPGRRILVVEDSDKTGGQMKLAKPRINAASTGERVAYAAAYVTPGAEAHVDYYCELVQSPRVVKWNFKHHPILVSSCFDIDEGLCRDPLQSANASAEPDPVIWTDKLQRAVGELLGIIENGASFVLIDGDQLGLHRFFAGRYVIPFPQSDGEYAGPPPDSETGIEAFERLRRDKIMDYVVVAWPAFWWMEYYENFFAMLRSQFPVLMDNARLNIFDLSEDAK